MSETAGGCCAPSAGRGNDMPETSQPAGDSGSTEGMVRLDGGEFLMGSEDPRAYPDDGEGPVRRVTVEPFHINTTAVSNAEFAEFVRTTGYRTEAERFEWSFVFGGLLPDEFSPTQGVAAAPWWRVVPGSDWAHPEGPQSSVYDRQHHPVVHVTWADALSYCAWAGLRLPTEAEWEYAARGGLSGCAFPWGDEREPDGRHRMNVWQGEFPRRNDLGDGWYGTCPVDEFPPNGFGLRNTTGNVWEWCQDRFGEPDFIPRNSAGPNVPEKGQRRVAKGGSYLCHDSYCLRYRVSARQGLTPDSSIGNTGFRVARAA